MGNKKEKLEDHILEIEDRIEDDYEARKNRMRTKNFIIFLLMGKEEETAETMERKVRAILSNPEAAIALPVDMAEGFQSCSEMILEAVREAGNRHIYVDNLVRLYLCPVCFADSGSMSKTVAFLENLSRSLFEHDKQPVWQPYLILNRPYEPAAVCEAFAQLRRFITNKDSTREVHRCCVLSDEDVNGFAVTQESLLQTISMIAVLQCIDCRTANSQEMINKMVCVDVNDSEGCSDFFTARTTSIVNPRRSYTLQRIVSAFRYFSGETDSSAGTAIERIRYSFLNDIIKPYLEKLPQLEGNVTLYPIYGVINDGATVHERLDRMIREKYMQPLYGGQAVKDQQKKAKEQFLAQYFENNGSAKNLKDSVSDGSIATAFEKARNELNPGIVFNDLPAKGFNEFREGEYGMARAHVIEKVSGASRELLGRLEEELTGRSFRECLNGIQQKTEIFTAAIEDRLRRLGEVETVLMTDGSDGEYDKATQDDWLKSAVLNHQERFRKLNRRFDELIYRLILGDEKVGFPQMLDVCYEAVRGFNYTNEDYLRRLSEECAANDERATDYVLAMNRNLGYTLRFLNRIETNDARCIIGDPSNYFFRSLKANAGYRGIPFEFKGFDRIEVLQLSGAFDPEDLRNWETIAGGGPKA